jgi:hypothetical protein
MVEPLDAEALAGAIATALRDANLRARLTAQGLHRAALFSWEATARTIVATYTQACQSGGRRVAHEPPRWKDIAVAIERVVQGARTR